MREIAAAALAAEVTRLGTMVSHVFIVDRSGVELHAPGDVLGPGHAKLLAAEGLGNVYLLEPSDKIDEVVDQLGVVRRPPVEIREGDVVAREVRSSDGKVKIAPGTRLDAAGVAAVGAARVATVPVCAREREVEAQLASAYLSKGGLSPVRPVRPDPVQLAAQAPVFFPISPRAEVLVAVEDDGVRLRIFNLLMSAGHGVREQRTWDDGAAERARADVVLLGVDAAAEACPKVRESILYRASTILVCAEDGKGPQVYKALQAGANDILSLPVRQDVLLEKVRACVALQGKRTTVKPGILKERRTTPREKRAMTCELRDPALGRPLEVTTATIVEFGDGGVRIEYGLLEAARVADYRPHSVHPGHFFYNYARANPLGRDFMVTITAPGQPSLESSARVTHVSRSLSAEVAGLAFTRVQQGATKRLTSVRKPQP